MLLTDILSKNIVVSQDELAADPALLRDVQVRLVVWGMYPAHKVDGLWGAITHGALINFCNKIHLNSAASKRYGASFASALLGRPTELITLAQATAIFGRSPTAEQMLDLNRCLVRFEINTPARLQHFMAQIGAESLGGKYCCELASGDAYEGRSDLGNTHRGDGRKFKGCGFLQVTGRKWHTDFANFIGDPKVVELGTAYTAQHYAASISGYWWQVNRVNERINKGATCRQISAIVNGKDPANGLAERLRYYNSACRILK